MLNTVESGRNRMNQFKIRMVVSKRVEHNQTIASIATGTTTKIPRYFLSYLERHIRRHKIIIFEWTCPFEFRP